MARFNHPINNFLSGEISPKILARSETTEYRQGCEKLLNMVPQVQGGITRRPGTQHIATNLDSLAITSDVGIFPFNISNSESYTIAIKYVANAGGYTGKIYVVNSNTLVEYAVPYSTTWSSLGYNLHIPAAADIATLQHSQYGDTLLFCAANVSPFLVVRTALNTLEIRPHWFPLLGSATLIEAGFPWQPVNTTSIVMTISAVAVGSRTLTIASGSGYSFVASMVDAYGTDRATFFCFVDGANYGFAYVTGYTSTTVVTVQVTKALPAPMAVGGLSTWNESFWSSYRGFPRACSFIDQRSIFAGSAAFPNVVWGSQFENIYIKVNILNQLVVGTVTNSMPFTHQVSSTENSQFQWLSSGKKLTGGAGGREYQIAATNGTSGIGATNTGSNAETSYGSAYVQPVRLDSTIVFVQRSTRKILEYVFDLREESYKVRDLSTIADHMVLKGLGRFASPAVPKFVKMQYAPSDDIIWCLDSNGVLTSITRNKTTESLAWAEHDLGGLFGGENAVVTSIAVVNSGDGTHDDLWMIVKRTINAGTKYYLERMNKDFLFDSLTSASASIVDKPVYVDSAKLVQLGAPGVTFTGYSHLIGQTVACLADGLYHGEKVVDGSGNIVLSSSATELIAGLKYSSKVTPTIPDVGSQTGSSLGRPKKTDKLSIRFHRAVGAKMTRVSDSLTEDIIFRPVNLAANLPIPLFNGFKDLDFPGTWEKDDRFTIETSLPLPMGILGIFVRGTSND